MFPLFCPTLYHKTCEVKTDQRMSKNQVFLFLFWRKIYLLSAKTQVCKCIVALKLLRSQHVAQRHFSRVNVCCHRLLLSWDKLYFLWLLTLPPPFKTDWDILTDVSYWGQGAVLGMCFKGGMYFVFTTNYHVRDLKMVQVAASLVKIFGDCYLYLYCPPCTV